MSDREAMFKRYGIRSLFKAYLQSDQFANEKDEFKAEAFETYENRRWLLGLIQENTARTIHKPLHRVFLMNSVYYPLVADLIGSILESHHKLAY